MRTFWLLYAVLSCTACLLEQQAVLAGATLALGVGLAWLWPLASGR